MDDRITGHTLCLSIDGEPRIDVDTALSMLREELRSRPNMAQCLDMAIADARRFRSESLLEWAVVDGHGRWHRVVAVNSATKVLTTEPSA